MDNFSAGDARVACPMFQSEYGGPPPTSALQLRIVKIGYKLATTLNEKWHSRMPSFDTSCMCSYCFAAECNNIYYAIAMWSRAIAANRMTDGDKILELRRMAIADDAPKNTASRMISIMTRLIKKERPDLVKLVSYQDTEVHKGTIYKASGWTAVENKGGFVSWNEKTTKARKRIEQSQAPKIRWELKLKN